MRKATKGVPSKVNWDSYKMFVERECELLKEQTKALIDHMKTKLTKFEIMYQINFTQLQRHVVII